MQTNHCPFIEGCPMFKYFQKFMKKVYLNMYCQGFYRDCERRTLKLSGKEVPAQMLPNGDMLWDPEHENAPDNGEFLSE
jgi:hypothetical protein